MIKSIVLIALLLLSGSSYSQTNVVVALSGTIAGEPSLQASFVAGYESEGNAWTGNFTVLENTAVVTAMAYAQTNGYNLVLRNTGNSSTLPAQIDSFYNQGIQYISCSGSNSYHANMGSNANLTNIIICGAGEDENMTSYPCEFYGIHPYNTFQITNMVQGTGDTLTITVNTARNGVFFVTPGYKVTFGKVTGFSNVPAGQVSVVKQVANGLYNSFTIIHNAGTGSFVSGNVSVFYQSYSHAYIAGQIACIKDRLSCTWWEARYRARVTASEDNVYDTYNGYGKIGIDNAVYAFLEIPPDPYNTLGSPGELTVTQINDNFIFSMTAVTNALKYTIYDNGVAIATALNSSNVYLNIPRKYKSEGGIHRFHYAAQRGSQIAIGDTTTIKWFMFPRIYTKNN